MRGFRSTTGLLGLLALNLALYHTSGLALDHDADGITDTHDNCYLVGNADQRDSDNDGYGNRCDTDLNNDNVTNLLDVGLLRAAFGSNGPAADFNGDGVVNLLDVGILRTYFGRPPGPGAAPGPAISAAEAARFLSQATFGGTAADIEHLQELGDFDAWLEEQVAVPRQTLLQQSRGLYQANYDFCIANPPEWGCPAPLTDIADTSNDYFRYVWWNHIVTGQDQLRQRMAFALSQILVVSDKSPTLDAAAFGMASYYDQLITYGLGNYRDLLTAVTLHPVMGMYLSMVRNEKADTDRHIRPDENFARELLQLFSIGVHRLNLDGSVMTDATGKPVPTYDQADVEALARVFTGWNFANLDWTTWSGSADLTRHMVPVQGFHDGDGKTLLDGHTLPAGQSVTQDLEDALEMVFNHPNTGPFLASQLIKRFTTSNPSPAYVARVASVFNDNGSGERGDLSAVARAILLDPEARGGVAVQASFGKIREPVLRLAQLFRVFDAQPIAGGAWDVPPTVAVFNSPAGWGGIREIENEVGQNLLAAPSVFNFYRPDYTPPGPLADSGLLAPELQLWTENAVMAMSNIVNFHLHEAEPGGSWTYLNLAPEIALSDQTDALIDRLDLLLTSGAMSSHLRDTLHALLTDRVYSADDAGKLAKVRDAISLVVNSPEYLVQK